MKKSSNSVSWSPVVYLLLAALYSYLSIRASKLSEFTFSMSFILMKMNLRWVFWLTTTLAVACLLPLINLIFRGLHERHLLPKPFDWFYQEGFESDFARFLVALRSRFHSLAGQLTAVGLAILLFVAFVSNTYLVRDREVNNYLNEYVIGILGTSGFHQAPMTALDYEYPLGVVRLGSREKNITVLELGLFMASHDVSQYLKNCLTIVCDLDSVGAKAVLIDIRNMVSLRSGADYKLLEELSRSGNVVFGTPDYFPFPQAKFSRGIYTLREFEVRWNPILSRTQPAGDALGNPAGPADVMLELLRKYHGYPPNLSPRQIGSTLVFGDYRMPVAKDGWMYTRDRWSETANWARVHATQGYSSDTLTYQYGGGFKKNLKDFREQFKDKIFFISWGGNSTMETFMYYRAYVAALENIIQNNVIRKVEISPLWLTIFCIVVSVLIAYKFRPLMSVLMIFFFGVLLLIADSLLYDRMDTLVEIIYPLLSILMTMVIFPALAFVDRLGNAR